MKIISLPVFSLSRSFWCTRSKTKEAQWDSALGDLPPIFFSLPLRTARHVADSGGKSFRSTMNKTRGVNDGGYCRGSDCLFSNFSNPGHPNYMEMKIMPPVKALRDFRKNTHCAEQATCNVFRYIVQINKCVSIHLLVRPACTEG